tara:strand:- start:3089 stop:3505 length:417 start_codon:yes stop_codon:yes gene_type:complete
MAKVTLKNKLIFLPALFLLASCSAIPAPFAYIGQAMSVGDGISYSKTGKGIGDHLLDSATGKECKIWRFIDGEKICKDPIEQLADQMLADKTCITWSFDDNDKPICINRRRNNESHDPDIGYIPYKHSLERGTEIRGR